MKQVVTSAQELGQLLHLEDAVCQRLQVYADLLVKWQAKINLVGPETIPTLWQRHILDSAQLFPHCPHTIHRVMDIGSGAGFPGLVLAILGLPDVHLVESDARKCAFMREAARVTETKVTIHNRRIEQCPPMGADLVTARALASLDKLLDWASPHLLPEGHCLFLKGQGAEDELTQAVKQWDISVQRIPSLTEPTAMILKVSEVRRGECP